MTVRDKIKVWTVTLIFLVAAAVSALLVGEVGINYSLSDYLDESKGTKQALNIINDEFGMTTDIKVMVTDIGKDDTAEITKKLSAIPGVMGVNFDAESEKNYKNNTALFTVFVKGDEYSENANNVYSQIQKLMDKQYGSRVSYGGTVASTSSLRDVITGEMGYILLISILLVIVILLITAKSYLEPFVLLLASGIAVIINLGTNIMFGSISYITNSVAAILQLALSIDYSITLLNAYRENKANISDSYAAVIHTVKSVARPVVASALTTVAGLFALLFMSFGMGFDLGVVLIKGVVISLVASLFLFPSLILLFEKSFAKTGKRCLSFKGSGVSAFAVKCRRVIIPIFLVVVALCFFVKDGLEFGFSTNFGEEDEVGKVFGSNSTVVLVYENGEDNIASENAFIKNISGLKKSDGSPMLISCNAISNTVAKPVLPAEAASLLGVEKQDADLLFAFRAVHKDKEIIKLSTAELVLFADELIKTDPRASALVNDELKGQIQTGASLLKDPESSLSGLLSKKYDYESQCDILYDMGKLLGGMEEKPSPQLMAGVYAMYLASNTPEAIPAATATELIDFVGEQAENSLLASFIDEEKGAQLAAAQKLIANAEKSFVGKEHSMMLLSLDLPVQSEDTTAFMKCAEEAMKENFGKGYLAGLIPSTYDLMIAFSYDDVLINTITVISLLLIVLLLFRSLSLPVVLVSIIQGAVWFAMTAMHLGGRTEFFMSYIMSNCILMGATIDYGILMSSNYLTNRKTMDKVSALKAALKSTLPTVFTSGMTMIIAGFVIHFISSQNAIADTGLIIGMGTIASCIFIVVVLPAILYSWDKILLKLTVKQKEKTVV